MDSSMLFQRELYESLRKYRDKIAVHSVQRDLTYEEVDRYSDIILCRLREAGIPQKAQVTLMMTSKIDIILAMTACLKGGYIFIPFDMEYPHQRLKTMFDSIDSTVILTDEANELSSKDIAAHKEVVTVILNEEFYSRKVFQISEFCEECYGDDDPIYIFYTSGSTGVPKAIVGRNKGLTHFINWEIETFQLDEQSRISQLTTPCHDPILRDVYAAFLCGGTTCIPENKEAVLDLNKLAKWMDDEKLTLIHCTPSLFQALNEIDLREYSFENLKYILMAGEQISKKALEKWFNIYQDRITCVNLYGSTETTMVKSYYLIQKEDVKKNSIPIGKAIKGAKFILLDKDMHVCSKGKVGEIYIRTPYRSLGYYNKEYNNTCFVVNPFGENKEDLLYKTGDLAKLLEDGNYEFHGRIDRQVKIRGIRVELDEIEKCLGSFPGISECAIVLKNKDGVDGSPEMIAFYAADEKKNSDALREFIGNTINDNIVPYVYVHMDKLPRLANGKVNYKELSNYDTKTEEETLVEPHNKTEEKLLAIWKDILGKEEIGVNQNFLQIGGHSLLIMTMITRINREFDVEISLGEIFAGATIERLARILREKQRAEPTELMMRAEQKAHYALSNAQLRIYTLCRNNPNSIVYNMPAAYWVKGDISLSRMEMAFWKIIERHEILRTKFEVIDGNAVQTVLEDLSFRMESACIKKDDVNSYIKSFIRPFALDNPPLVRTALLSVEDYGHLFLVDFHHIVGDAASMEIIIKELVQFYAGDSLQEANYQYKDYSEWLNTYVTSSAYKEQEEYWLNLYMEVPPALNLPTDFSRTAMLTNKGETLHKALESALSQKIQGYSKQETVTPNIVMLSAFLALLYRYSKQSEIVVGTVVAGRTRSEEEGVVGPFINTLALKNQLNGDMSFKELVQEVKKSFVGAYQNQEYAFDDLVRQINPKTEWNRNPLFDVAFDYQNEEKHNIQIKDITFEPEFLETENAKFDLCIHVTELKDCFSVGIEYRTDLFKQETVMRMLAQYIQLLGMGLEEPDKKICMLDMLTDQERCLIENRSEGIKEVQKQETISARFEEMVRLYPDQTAMEYEDKSGNLIALSYREVNERANRFAGYLCFQNVSAGEIVGVMMGDVNKVVISILGILKLGAVYLPIGIGYYPDSFIEEIITDSKMTAFIIESTEEQSIKGLIENIRGKAQAPQVVEYEKFNEVSDEFSKDNIAGTHTEESGAYAIYTSGTTGRPKGVMIYHKGITNLMKHIQEELHITTQSRVLQFSSLSFDMSVWEIFITILNGATLCIFNRKNGVDELENFLRERKISLATLTPSVLRVISADGLPELKTVVSAGESCTNDILQKWNSGRTFVNAYGPTETTICATMRIVDDMNPNNIGKPITNMRCCILDENRQACPIGIPGELYVGGIGTAKGYLNNDELTRQKFVLVEGFGSELLYRSGDLAKWTENGDIEILGRIDEQVKIRGFRIETGFIEAKMCENDNITSAFVIKHDEELFAFYTDENPVDANKIKDYLGEYVPSYMIPSHFVRLDELPLTQGGKVDKRKLYDLCEQNVEECEQNSTKESDGAPRNEFEKKLIIIWSEVLRKENLTIDDNFFDNGGHSLNAIQVINKAKEEGIPLKVEDLFVCKTIRNLSDQC